MAQGKKFHVYCLVNLGKPIYVGMSTNVQKRKQQHKKNKQFQNLFILKSFDNKKDALICENGIITFMSILNNSEFVNGLDVNIKLEFDFLNSPKHFN